MNIETANRLSELRRKRGFSQEGLAEKLGVSRQAVSKWERGEASPDTDNLIALARLYGVSIDELLGHVPEARADGMPHDDAGQSEQPKNKTSVRFEDGITVEDGDDRVYLGSGGVHVSDGKDEVHIDRSGVSVNGRRYGLTAGLRRLNGAIVLLCSAAYAVLGAVWNLWHPAWLIFFVPPIFSSVVEAVEKRDMRKFCFPVFATMVYLLLGFLKNLWHPGWIVFLFIPVFYTLVPNKRKLEEDAEN